jgi:hypothetical protein
MMSSHNYDAATGAIEIRDLLPGTYSVIALAQDAPVPGPGGPPGQSLAMIPVTVSASDVDGIALALVPAVSIPGRLRADGLLPASMTMDRFRVRLVPAGANSALLTMQVQLAAASFGNANVGADGAFRLNNVAPGDYRVEVAGLPGGGNPSIQTFLKEARFDGSDVLGSLFRFSGTTNGSLDIVIGVGGGRVNGIVTDARSQPIPSTRVVMVPDRARHRTDLHKLATTDQNGQFVLSGIPPGDYKVFAWEALEEFAWFDPDVLARYETRGRSVRVTEASTETIDVRIIPPEGAR